MEIRWLQSFIAVAEELHFSRAARRLNLAQPALTAQINQLERAIGTPLLLRTNRVSGLTAAGKALLPEARSIIDHLGRLVGTASRAGKGEIGELRIGVIPPAATTSLAGSLRKFSAQFPTVGLSVRQGDQALLLERLSNRELDLVIGRPVPRRHGPAHLAQRRLLREEQGIIVREDDPLARSERVAVGKLNGMRLLLLRDNIYFGQLLLGHAAKHGATLYPVHAAQDFPSLHWMVRSGLGIAPCSLLLADGLPRGLVALPLNPPPSQIPINAIWIGPQPEPAVTRFLDLNSSGPTIENR